MHGHSIYKLYGEVIPCKVYDAGFAVHVPQTPFSVRNGAAGSVRTKALDAEKAFPTMLRDAEIQRPLRFLVTATAVVVLVKFAFFFFGREKFVKGEADFVEQVARTVVAGCCAFFLRYAEVESRN